VTLIVTILADGFADWETTMLNAVAKSYYGLETAYASPGGRPVTSMGGLRAQPDHALEATDLDALDALIVCGGAIWQTPEAPDLGPLLRDAHQRGKIIGAICDGTLATARTGVLDTVRHTSNGSGYLDQTGYKGAALYQDVPYAITDRTIITAPATAPVSFMAAVMKALGKADDNLDFYVGMHAKQYQQGA
jgi:putative intracellular protease/amidase